MCVLTVQACANKERLPPEFTFTTHITDQGYKLFQLSFPALELRQTARNPQYDRGTQQRYREKYIDRVFEQAVEISKFCRKGHFQLGRYAGETSQRVRGQCRELATEQDRIKFPNTLTRW